MFLPLGPFPLPLSLSPLSLPSSLPLPFTYSGYRLLLSLHQCSGTSLPVYRFNYTLPSSLPALTQCSFIPPSLTHSHLPNSLLPSSLIKCSSLPSPPHSLTHNPCVQVLFVPPPLSLHFPPILTFVYRFFLFLTHSNSSSLTFLPHSLPLSLSPR